MIHIEHFTFNAFQTRCSIAWSDDKYCAFVDPGCSTSKELAALTEFVSAQNLKPVCIMLTHAHFDHIYGVSELVKTYGIPVYMHPGEKFTIDITNPTVCGAYGLPLPDTTFLQSFAEIKEGDIIEVGSLKFQVIETPGHSCGGVCFLENNEKVLFSGDTLFAGAIGRSDHPGGDYDLLIGSIMNKLMPLDGSVTVIPGHGPCSDITTEGMTNPFLQPFNEPYED